MDPDVIDASSIRKKIIEHLATTVNGCLAELGYFPGTIQKLQQLEHEAARLREENVKLYTDNRKLVQWHQTANIEMEMLRAELAKFGRVIPTQLPHGIIGGQPMRQQLPHPPPGMILVPAPNAFVAQPHPVAQQSNARASSSSRRVSLPSIHTGTLPPSHPPMSAPPAPSARSMMPQHANIQQATRIGRPRSQHNSPIAPMPQVPIALPVPTPVPPIAPTQLRHPVIVIPTPGPASGPIPAAVKSWDKQTKSPAEVIDLTSLDNDEPESISDAARKKPRLDTPPTPAPVFSLGGQLQPADVQSPVSAVPTAPPETPLSNSEPTPSSEPAPDRDVQMQSEESQANEGTEDTEDEMEIEVELDEDGLVSIQSCLDQAFSRDEGSGQICLMCNARYEVIVKEDPNAQKPKPFVNTDKADLVKHCETDHPIGWANLRSPPDMED